jgi:hypothetical protein
MSLYDFLQELRLDEIDIEREEDAGREISFEEVLDSDVNESNLPK